MSGLPLRQNVADLFASGLRAATCSSGTQEDVTLGCRHDAPIHEVVLATVPRHISATQNHRRLDETGASVHVDLDLGFGERVIRNFGEFGIERERRPSGVMYCLEFEAVPVAEHTGHGDRSGKLLEVSGARFVGHPVECDAGCHSGPSAWIGGALGSHSEQNR
jgi:hypothetical protein